MCAAAVQGELSGLQVLMAGVVVVGSGVATTALWFFSQRYVGELAALPAAAPGGAERLCFSVLDFWGKRQARPGPSPFHTQCEGRLAAKLAASAALRLLLLSADSVTELQVCLRGLSPSCLLSRHLAVTCAGRAAGACGARRGCHTAL